MFPEPETLFDDYATRPVALPENEQTIARHLTNQDLKRNPPAGLSPEATRTWPNTVPTEVAAGGHTLTGRELVRWKYRRFMQDYLACVQGVDDAVGTVLDYLETSGLAENTIVIYTTDNGWYMGELGLYDKRFMYEPGLRVPLLASGPGVAAGITPEAFVANIDLAPTFLDLAGEKIPADMQGRSLVPLFAGGKPDGWRSSIYYRYYHDPGDHNTAAHYGVRTDTHKLIYFWRRNQWECFDLVKDPQELKNVYNDPAEQATVAKLKAELYRLKKELGDEADRFANNEDQPKETSYVQPGQKKKKGAAQ